MLVVGGQALMKKLLVRLSEKLIKMGGEQKSSAKTVVATSGMFLMERVLRQKIPDTV